MSTPGSVGRKLLAILAVAVGLLLVLAALLLVIVNSGVATKRAVDLVLPSVSQALGRDVTLRDAKLKVLPTARVTLAGLAVAGRPGEPALLESESLDVEVALWPLLRSLGKEVAVRAFTLVRPSVNLVKAKDGTWNFEGLGATRAPSKPATPAASAPPAAAAPPGSRSRVAVDLVKVDQASIRVFDQTLGTNGAALALTMLDFEAHNVGPGLPLDARLAAALADTRQNLHAQLSIAKLPAGVPQGPEDWPEMQGSVKLAALALDRVHSLFPGDVGAIVRGGSASLDAKLATVKGEYRVEGTGELKDVRLRGQPSAGRFRAVAVWSPARPNAARLDVTDLVLRGPGIDLGGNVSVATAPVRAWFVLTGPLLDLDAVMGILPEAPAPAKPAAAAPTGDVVPEATRREIQSASARGTIAVEKLKGGRLEANDLKARVTLSRGILTLEEMSATVFGGRVSAAGTTVSLAEKIPAWKLAASLSGLDLEKTIAAFAGRAPLLGKLDGKLEVAGKGTEWEKIRSGLDGLAAIAVKDGTLTTTDLGNSVLGGISQGLAALGKGNVARKIAGAGGRTRFKDLAARFTVKDGFLAAQSPFRFGTSAGDVALGGRVGLDGRLDLQGTTVVPKKTLAEIAPGLSLPDKLEVPLALGGTLSSPSVSVRADQAVASLARSEAKQAIQGARQKAEKEGRKAAEGLFQRFKRK